MPHEYSLSLKKDIDNLFKHGKKRYSNNFSLIFLPSQSIKIAYIVPKKNVNKASFRNYSKRVMREVVRDTILRNPSKKYNLAIVCKRNLKEVVKDRGFDSVKGELTNLLKSMN